MRIKVFILALLIALLPSCGAAKVVEYKVKVVKEYPHDVTSYTQGLFFHDGRFYESTGQWGKQRSRQTRQEYPTKPMQHTDSGDIFSFLPFKFADSLLKEYAYLTMR